MADANKFNDIRAVQLSEEFALKVTEQIYDDDPGRFDHNVDSQKMTLLYDDVADGFENVLRGLRW